MIWTKRIGDELYVYWRGELIYKRWVKMSDEYGRVFNKVGVY